MNDPSLVLRSSSDLRLDYHAPPELRPAETLYVRPDAPPVVARRGGLTQVVLPVGQPWTRNPSVWQVAPGEWFVVVERPVDGGPAPRSGVGRIRASGTSERMWSRSPVSTTVCSRVAAWLNGFAGDWDTETVSSRSKP